MTLPAASRGYISFRAVRQEVTLWGQPLAVLLYAGPLAPGQSEHHDGRYSLVTIPRDPSAERLFLQREVWPAINSPFLSTGGFRGLTPAQAPAPDDPRLEHLQRNLLRAAWHPLALDMGLTGATPGAPGGRDTAFRRLQDTVIREEERNGFLHEAQHALDEAWKAQPERYPQPQEDGERSEHRAALAALAHSASPHYELYQSVRQYRQRLPDYEGAVRLLLEDLSQAAMATAEPLPGVRRDRNLTLQMPRLHADDLRRLAARAFASRYAAEDRAAGYTLRYVPESAAAAGVSPGAERGHILPEDLPPDGSEDQPAAFWRVKGSRVETAGAHVYLSSAGVRPARSGERFGLALGGTGYVAVHVRAPASASMLEVTGGRFAADADAGRNLPAVLRVGPGSAIIPLQGEDGLFRAVLPGDAAMNGVLRLVLEGDAAAPAAAFLTGLAIRPLDR